MSDVSMSIPTMLKARFRKVYGKNAPYSSSILRGMDNAGVAREEILMQARLPEALVNFLLEIDRKLDTILGHLQGESLTDDFPHAGRITSLSAQALVLETEDPLQIGEFLEIIIFLEEFPLHFVIVRGEITGNHRASFEAPYAAYSIPYSCVDDEHRESIIRFIFQEERRRIRLQKQGE